VKDIYAIVVHCSDSDIPEHDSVAVIEEWHKARGFKKIGYHFVIHKDGSVSTGRGVNEQGAHCVGHNSNTIGVCLTGRKDFSIEQYISLGMIKQQLDSYFGKKLQLIPHRKLAKGKTCPNFDCKLFS
jgi:N-acetylmuramoyl-L-alanine amidase